MEDEKRLEELVSTLTEDYFQLKNQFDPRKYNPCLMDLCTALELSLGKGIYTHQKRHQKRSAPGRLVEELEEVIPFCIHMLRGSILGVDLKELLGGSYPAFGGASNLLKEGGLQKARQEYLACLKNKAIWVAARVLREAAGSSPAMALLLERNFKEFSGEEPPLLPKMEFSPLNSETIPKVLKFVKDSFAYYYSPEYDLLGINRVSLGLYWCYYPWRGTSQDKERYRLTMPKKVEDSQKMLLYYSEADDVHRYIDTFHKIHEIYQIETPLNF